MELGLCIEMAFEPLPFPDRIRAAADAGFKNVEMWFIDYSNKDKPEDLARIAESTGVTITNTVVGSPDGTMGGGLCNPANRDQWLERTKLTLDFNKRANIAATIVCTGNTIDGMSDEQMNDSVIEGLKATAALAEAAGITLLLEPLNTTVDHAGYFVTNSTQGAAICRAVGSDRMKMLYDCYHMQIMEGDLVRHITNSLDVIGHFHSAGSLGRNELFTGEVDYPFVLDQIEKTDYAGVFGLEYMPIGDHAKSVKAVKQYLKR